MQIVTILSTGIAKTITETATNENPDNLIGIGGIIATIVVGIITCLVTWKVTMKTIEELKIAYSARIFPILSNSITELNLVDLQIKYKDKKLLNPCLLTIDVINNGNKSIKNPPIRVRVEDDIEIIPCYIEDIPPGYSELWKIEKKEANSCCIKLEHINPKQIVKARFLLNSFPDKDIIFECATPDVSVQKISSVIEAKREEVRISNLHLGDVLMIIVTFLLFIKLDEWGYYLSYVINNSQLRYYLNAYELMFYVIGVLLFTIIFNLCGIKNIDKLCLDNIKSRNFLLIILVVICLFLFFIIIFNIIKNVLIQYTIAFFTIIAWAMVLHIWCRVKRSR